MRASFRPNAVRPSSAVARRRWRAAGALAALCSVAAIGYAWLAQAQANQQLRAMLQVVTDRQEGAGANGTSSGSGSGLTGGVKAMIDSLLPGREHECEQHSALFPSIYNDLIPWMTRGIRREDFAECDKQGFSRVPGARYMGAFAIIDNVMYCVNPPMPDWVNALYFLSLADIQETVLQYGVPDMEFRLQFTDWPQIPIDQDHAGVPLGTEPACPLFSWVKDARSLDILVPDGDFLKHSFDEWVANRSAADPEEWATKRGTAVGRYTNFPSGHRAASRRGETIVPRDYYSELSDATNGSHLDVGMVEKRGWLPIQEQLSHKYSLSVDGNTASTRLQLVLAADQVALKHISNYWMYFEAALQPWVHYVPVGSYDAKDILPIIDWLRDRDDEARRIARAGMAFAQRHLTRPGRLCYLRQLLREYASLFRYQPSLSDHENYTLLEDEVQRYNNTEAFFTMHHKGYMEFFNWRNEGIEPHAAIPVTL